jgi:hypothetical protein
MTAKNNTPAFPCEWDYIGSNREAANGMTLRDYFAAKALTGLIGGRSWAHVQGDDAVISAWANAAYAVADAMLKAREQ